MVRLDADVSIHNLHVGGAALVIENGKSLVLNSHIDHNDGIGVSVVENTGYIRLDGSDTLTQLRINGVATLRGDGVLELSDSSQNLVWGQGSQENFLVNEVGHTIRGSGSLGAHTLGLVNGGLIEATNPDNPLYVHPDNFGLLNSGTLKASNGATLYLSGDITNIARADHVGELVAEGAGSFLDITNANIHGNSVLRILDAAQLTLSGSSFTGGTISIDGEARVQNNGTASTLENVGVSGAGRLAVAPGATLSLTGDLDNRGTVRLDGDGSGASRLNINNEVTLGGGGRIDLSDSPNNLIFAYYGYKLTNADNLIGGSGSVYGTLDNAGTIEATNAANRLDVTLVGYYGLDARNRGLLQARDGATLGVYGGFDNSGGTIRARDGSTVELHSATVQGGLVQAEAGGNVVFGYGSNFNSGILADNAGRVLVNDSASVHTTNPFSNYGTVEIASGGKFLVDNGGGFLQSQGTTHVNGTLTAAQVDLQGGGLSGSGTINGSLTNAAGMLSPGNSPGLLTVQGDYVQQQDGWLHIEVGGATSPGLDYDRLSVLGNAHLGGTLEVSLYNNYQPGFNDLLVFLAAGSITGSFDHFIFPTFNGMTFDLVLDNTTASLITRPVPIPAAFWLFGSALVFVWRFGTRRHYAV